MEYNKSGLFCSPGPNGIKKFQSWDFQDGILQNPGIPGFFGTGLACNFIPGIYQKSTGSLGISLSAHKFGQIHTFWRTYWFLKYIRQTKVSSIPSCGKQQERAGVQCCWQRGDSKKSLPHTRESRSLSYCQIQP